MTYFTRYVYFLYSNMSTVKEFVSNMDDHDIIIT